MGNVVISCLFSVDNNYDQPRNNLVCWWGSRPELGDICKALGWKPLEELTDEGVINVVNIWKGQETRISDINYRLQEVKEGTQLT